MKNLLIIITLIPISLMAQENSFDQRVFDGYENYREKSLTQRRIKHSQIQALITEIGKKKGFQVTKLGESVEGRDISLISTGTGDIDVLLWSQMHGDEPTATLAIFDILNFLSDGSELKQEKEDMLKNVKLHFVPMLNPDGAELFKRRNALDIDLNRDALRLQTPEGRILKSVRDSLDAGFGFNLHDQSKYYNAERTDKPATISYLAPAYNYEKEINNVRGNAMKIIVLMNDIIQKYAPGQVGRYADDFEPRAFGDNIQKWGTSAILIESGGYANDPEKQFIRKLNYISILTAVFTIANGGYQGISIDKYEKIPNNDRKFFDLKIEKLTYNFLGKEYIVDVGIHLEENDNTDHTGFHYIGKVSEIGDLSTYYGYRTIDATGLEYKVGKLYEEKVQNTESIKDIDIKKLLGKGYTSLQLKNLDESLKFSPFPINISKTGKGEKSELKMGSEATFVLMDGGQLKYVLVNGFLFDPEEPNYGIVNGVIR